MIRKSSDLKSDYPNNYYYCFVVVIVFIFLNNFTVKKLLKEPDFAFLGFQFTSIFESIIFGAKE